MLQLRIVIALGAALAVAAPNVARAQNIQSIAGTSIPDVSALEYRAVKMTIPTHRRTSEPASEQVAHLWIVPQRQGEAEPSFGIGWDGAPYEIQSVGEKADWRADVEAFLASENRFAANPLAFGGQSVARQMLMTLDAADLQREVGAAMRLYSNNPQQDYLRNLRDAGVTSFAAGQFSQAQLQLNRLLEVWPAKTPDNLFDLRPEARRILADIERRAQEQPRPTDEIAGLMWDLQNVRAFQMTTPGSIGWTRNSTVQALIDAGDKAVEPLLDALENDERLTRSYYAARVRLGPGTLGTVRQAAQSALEILLNHRYDASNYQSSPAQQGADIAVQMRADWNKVKDTAPVDRVFNELNQSGQTAERLTEAAYELVRVNPPHGYRQVGPKLPGQTFYGEPLRARQNPSVSDVLEARIRELTGRALDADRSANASPNMNGLARELNTANELALILNKWDRARALPLLGAQLQRSQTYADTVGPLGTDEAQSDLNQTRRQFLAARANSPYRAEAMREYGAFLQRQPFGRVLSDDYRPLWRYADEPAMIEAAHALFDAPLKPFESAATWKTERYRGDDAFRLLASPLIQTPVFRAAVLRELKNQTVIGALVKSGADQAKIEVAAWKWSDQSVPLRGRKLENGESQPLRVCDLVGFWLYQKLPDEDGESRAGSMLDLTLPTAERDARLKQIAELVAQGRVVATEIGIEGIDY